MLLVYALTGKFTFILKDALQEAEEQQERHIRAAEKQPSFPDTIYTKPAPRDYELP
jgi:hypothetical protein